MPAVVYFFWPETARLSLEEVARNFGDEVAVHVHDVSEKPSNLDEAARISEAGETSKPQVVEAV
jgi:hypothetical protein